MIDLALLKELDLVNNAALSEAAGFERSFIATKIRRESELSVTDSKKIEEVLVGFAERIFIATGRAKEPEYKIVDNENGVGGKQIILE